MLSSRLEILVACRNCWKQHHYLFSWSSALTKTKPKLSLQNSSATVLLYSFWDWSPRWGWPQILASVLSASAGRGLKAGIASITSESSQRTSNPHENMGCEESPDSEEMVVYQLWDPLVRGPESGLHGLGAALTMLNFTDLFFHCLSSSSAALLTVSSVHMLSVPDRTYMLWGAGGVTLLP